VWITDDAGKRARGFVVWSITATVPIARAAARLQAPALMLKQGCPLSCISAPANIGKLQTAIVA
jgi:hypothetical protein